MRRALQKASQKTKGMLLGFAIGDTRHGAWAFMEQGAVEQANQLGARLTVISATSRAEQSTVIRESFASVWMGCLSRRWAMSKRIVRPDTQPVFRWLRARSAMPTSVLQSFATCVKICAPAPRCHRASAAADERTRHH